MPTAANIVLADAQATPVNHTFVPIGRDAKDPSIFWYEDQSAANAIGNWRVNISIRRPSPNVKAGESSKTRSYKVVVGLYEPVLETVSNNTVSGIAPAPTIAYTPKVLCTLDLPERSTLQNRKDLRKMVANLLGDAQVVAVIESLQSISY